MATIEELLRDTLKGVNDQHSQTGKDLNAAVAEVAKAVEAISGGLLRLKLRFVGAERSYSTYELILTYRGENPRELATYEVPLSGYPIRVFQYTPDDTPDPDTEVEPSERIASAEELAAYFRRMVTDPASPLVIFLAYAVRQLEEDKREVEQATAG